MTELNTNVSQSPDGKKNHLQEITQMRARVEQYTVEHYGHPLGPSTPIESETLMRVLSAIHFYQTYMAARSPSQEELGGVELMNVSSLPISVLCSRTSYQMI
jgi:hypothetical protein